MTDWSSLTPLLSDLILIETLREKGGVETCRVRREADGSVLVVKHLSVPQSPNQVEGLRLSGAFETDEDAKKYFAERMLDYKREVELLRKLAEATGLWAFTDAQFVEKEDGVGFDLFLFAPERETLPRHLARQPLTHAAAVKLAVALASQLSRLHEQGWLHAGVKPENLFCDEDGTFHIGDLGLVPLANLQYAAIDQSMLGDYTAPELFGITNAPNETIDVYSLGLILYSIFNGNHAPFEDEQTPHSAALQMRLDGEPLPPPLYADYEFTSIILKACAFKPEDRYENPQALYDALESYCKRNRLSDELLVPPLVTDDVQVTQEAIDEELQPMRAVEDNTDEAFAEHFSGVEEAVEEEETATEEEAVAEDDGRAMPAPTDETADGDVGATIGRPSDEEQGETEEAVDEAEAEPKKKKSLAWLWWLLGILAAGAAAFCLWWFVLTPTVNDISATATGSTEIAVTLDAEKPASTFAATASDAYGGTVEGVLDGDTFVFRDLTPGVSYVISVTTANGGRVNGRSEITVQTPPALQVTDLTAAVEDGVATISFATTDADKPWQVIVTSADGVEKTLDVKDGSVAFADLPFGTYTAKVVCEGETVLGETETEFVIEDPNALPVFAADAVTELRFEDGAIRWTLDGAFDPAAWQVVCELTELDEYATIPQAEAVWTFTDEAATETAIPLTGLAPEASYRAELRSGDVAYGEVTFTTAEAEKYTEHGCTNVFLGVFLAPAKENPKHNDFLTSRGAFAKGETAAFVVEAISTLQQGTWPITETVVVRNEDGKIVDVFTRDTTWDALWEGKYTSFVFPRTPNVSGKYTVTLLLDGKYVAQKPFEVQ